MSELKEGKPDLVDVAGYLKQGLLDVATQIVFAEGNKTALRLEGSVPILEISCGGLEAKILVLSAERDSPDNGEACRQGFSWVSDAANPFTLLGEATAEIAELEARVAELEEESGV